MTPPTFSRAWKASTNPAKQRKYRATAPLHLRRVFLSAHLVKSLRQQYKRRALPLRTGDKVKILRGGFKGKTGTIEHTDLAHYRVYITGIERTKKDGSKHLVPIDPSNLLIEELDLKDRRRITPARKAHQSLSKPAQESSRQTASPKQPLAAKKRTPKQGLSSPSTPVSPSQKAELSEKPSLP